jgi:hypothetical protein
MLITACVHHRDDMDMMSRGRVPEVLVFAGLVRLVAYDACLLFGGARITEVLEGESEGDKWYFCWYCTKPLRFVQRNSLTNLLILWLGVTV